MDRRFVFRLALITLAAMLVAAVDPRADALLDRAGMAGAMVLDVAPGSDAARAGIRPARSAPGRRIAMGDVIVALDGAPVRGAEDLVWLLDTRQPGETVTVTRLADRKTRDVALRLTAGG